MSTSVEVKRLHTLVTSEQQGTLRSLPFEMPEGIVRLQVVLEDVPPGPAVIDLGLADPHRMRGWSGGQGHSLDIQDNMATYGYLPGPLPKGTWTLVLGLYKLPREPFHMRARVTMFLAETRWYAGDLHVHSHHSDGVWSVAELVDQAEALHLDFIALTDHNTVAQNLLGHRPTALSLIPGMEFTTNLGHANLLGVPDPLPDWRWSPETPPLARLQEAEGRGSLISINHPFERSAPGVDWQHSWPPNAAMELWNGPWRPSNQEALTDWHRRLLLGQHVLAVGGSDVHAPGPLVRMAEPTTWIHARGGSVPSLMQGLRRGNVYLTRSTRGPRPTLRAGGYQWGDKIPHRLLSQVTIELTHLEVGDVVRTICDNESQDVTVDSQSHTLVVEIQEHHFIRLEVYRWDPFWHFAIPVLITNPMYLTKETPHDGT